MKSYNKLQTKRLFIGIPLIPDKKSIEFFYTIQKALQKEKITWTRPDQWHITLHFFGETDATKMSDIIACMNESFSTFLCEQVQVKNMGFFGSKHSPRVLWWNIFPAEKLIQIQRSLAEQLVLHNFEIEDRSFHPHLTLGRIKILKDIELFENLLSQYRDVVFFNTLIDKILLYESVLSSQGPTYIPLYTYLLKK
jgi:2'-5' RNA ligase